jgi:uncharacterized protein
MEVHNTNYIYLHGFASSPQSGKAKYISDRFSDIQIPLHIPDLNQNDFSHLTLTRQLKQVETLFSPTPTPITLIGSSFGGLTSTWLAEKHSQIQQLVLLAPAFGFLNYWLDKLGEEKITSWKNAEYLPVYHYGYNQYLPLHYHFLVDAANYDESQLKRSIPTLILHGIHDDVIPIQSSRKYAADRPWVQLIELDSDHSLNNVVSEIWQAVKTFCQFP